MEDQFTPQQDVVCVRGHRDAGLFRGETYRIAVVVRDGIDWLGETEGLIVSLPRESGAWIRYPYVWSFDRFKAA